MVVGEDEDMTSVDMVRLELLLRELSIGDICWFVNVFVVIRGESGFVSHALKLSSSF
jgi:hypothetical protein